MGLCHNGTGTHWDCVTVELVHNRTRTQQDWDTKTGTQRDWNTLGAGTHRDWVTTELGLGHNGTGT